MNYGLHISVITVTVRSWMCCSCTYPSGRRSADNRSGALNEADNLRRENEALRDCLSRLSEASLRITEDLDLDTVLQGVVDGARSLTGARMGGITTLDESGQLQDFMHLRPDTGGA